MSRLISFPQVFALAKGANYSLNASFTGLPLTSLLATGGFKFNQPAFQTPAANLYNSATTVYTISNTTNIDSAGLTYYNGGNLVDTAIKWTNGKSLGNWYQIQRHAGTPTGGSVSVYNGMLKITSGTINDGTGNNVLNRSTIHDVKFQRNGNQITENSASVIGWFNPNDKEAVSMYFKGYVEKADLIDTTTGLLDNAKCVQKTFFVGYRYAHNSDTYIPSINVIIGSYAGIGFIPTLVGGNYTWKAVYWTRRFSTDATDVFSSFDTGLSAFTPQRLKISISDTGIATWFANNMSTPIHTFNLLTASDILPWTSTVVNPLYASVMAIKGLDVANGFNEVLGSGTIYVQEAASWREFPNGKSGLTATLSAGNTVVLTSGTTTGLKVGMRLVKTSTGGGAFNVVTSTTGTFIGSITNSTTFTVVDHLFATANHATTGAITFDAGMIFRHNNFEDTNTEVTTTDIEYHTTGLQLLKKLK